MGTVHSCFFFGWWLGLVLPVFSFQYVCIVFILVVSCYYGIVVSYWLMVFGTLWLPFNFNSRVLKISFWKEHLNQWLSRSTTILTKRTSTSQLKYLNTNTQKKLKSKFWFGIGILMWRGLDNWISSWYTEK